MDDQFLRDHSREPRPEFARDLRERLGRQGAAAPVESSRAPRFRAALAFACAAIAVGAAFTLPPVRGSAQAFLDLFRVHNFAAVSVNEERLRSLEQGKLDLKAVLGGQIEKLKEPGEPQMFLTPASAGTAAGILVAVPATLPAGIVADSVRVEDDAAARITVDGKRVQDALDALDLRDVHLPAHWNGAQVTVRMPKMVAQRFHNKDRNVVLVQAKSPEISLPPGANLAEVGEIGLRVLGLSSAEAKRFASSIDWSSTFLVPVPASDAEFNEVEVRGHKALLVTAKESAEPSNRDGAKSSPEHKRRPGPPGSVLLWAEGGKVYALCGNLNSMDMMLMAGSIQ